MLLGTARAKCPNRQVVVGRLMLADSSSLGKLNRLRYFLVKVKLAVYAAPQ